MAAAAFDQSVAMLFLGDGVLQLLNRQNSEGIAQKSLEKQLGALPLYDVNEIYVDADALRERGFDTEHCSLLVKPLSRNEIAALISRCDIALNF